MAALRYEAILAVYSSHRLWQVQQRLGRLTDGDAETVQHAAAAPPAGGKIPNHNVLCMQSFLLHSNRCKLRLCVPASKSKRL